ncbi:MAG: ABC transporter permease subunit [Proteobacteria bacterium]|nr:ABC transporter permease subunit [Pseudomonadota bacterium]
MKGEKQVQSLFFGAAVLSAIVTLSIFVFMVVLGFPHVQSGSFFKLLVSPWSPDQGLYGIFPMIVGTTYIAALSTLFAFFLSFGSASFISVLGPEKPANVMMGVVQFMTGIPTVVYGFVGVFLLVPIVRELFESGSGLCILSASAVLALLVSPTMILIFCDHFSSVPRKYINAVDALGGTPVQKLLYVILPSSFRGMVTGLILAFGRAMGDTLVALMIAGNAVAVPDSVLDSARTLTAHIALVIAADFESLEFKTLFICGIVLYGFTALCIIVIRLLTQSNGRQR